MTEYLTAARPPRPDYSDSDDDDDEQPTPSEDDEDVFSTATVHQRQQTLAEPKRAATPSTSMDPWDDFDVAIASSLFASFDDLDAHHVGVDGRGGSGVGVGGGGGGGGKVSSARTRPQSARPAVRSRMMPTISSRLSSSRLMARQGGATSGVVDTGEGSTKRENALVENYRHTPATTVAAAAVGKGDGTTSSIVAENASNPGKSHHRRNSHDSGGAPLGQSNARVAPPRLPAHISSTESTTNRVEASRAVAECGLPVPPTSSSSSMKESLLDRQRFMYRIPAPPPVVEDMSPRKNILSHDAFIREKNVIDARLRRFKDIARGTGRGGGGKSSSSREDESADGNRNRAGRGGGGGGGSIDSMHTINSSRGGDGGNCAGGVEFERCDTQEIFTSTEGRVGGGGGGGGRGVASAVRVRAGRRAGTFVQTSGHGLGEI